MIYATQRNVRRPTPPRGDTREKGVAETEKVSFPAYATRHFPSSEVHYVLPCTHTHTKKTREASGRTGRPSAPVRNGDRLCARGFFSSVIRTQRGAYCESSRNPDAHTWYTHSRHVGLFTAVPTRRKKCISVCKASIPVSSLPSHKTRAFT